MSGHGYSNSFNIVTLDTNEKKYTVRIWRWDLDQNDWVKEPHYPDGKFEGYFAQNRNGKQVEGLVTHKSSSEINASQSPIRTYRDYAETFVDMEMLIRDKIDDWRSNPPIAEANSLTIQLRLIAVSMTFSWDHFIAPRIPRILKSYDDVNVDLDIVFVSPEYLELIQMQPADVNWIEEGKKRISRC